MNDLASELADYAAPCLLPAARVLGILVFLPGAGSPQVPPQARIVLAGGVSLLVASAVGVRPWVPVAPEQYLMVLLSELGLGLVVGWAVTVFLEAMRWVGEVMDLQVGLAAGAMLDPVSGTHGSLLGQFYYMTASAFFFVVDGHHWVLAAVGRSLERLPPGELAFGAGSLRLLLEAATSAVDIGVRLGASGLAALLLADLALAIVGRHVPQMNVFLVGIPAKLGAGIAVLMLAAPMLGPTLTGMVDGMRRVVMALLVGG